MKQALKKALAFLLKARPHLKRALSRYYYPTMHEDIDYLIHDCQVLITALDNGEKLPH